MNQTAPDNDQQRSVTSDQPSGPTDVGQHQPETETFGWRFHKWPFLIALGVTAIFYILVFLLADTSNGPLGRS